MNKVDQRAWEVMHELDYTIVTLWLTIFFFIFLQTAYHHDRVIFRWHDLVYFQLTV